MALTPELPSDVVVVNTFVSLRSDFVQLPRRAQSCPPAVQGPRKATRAAAKHAASPSTLLIYNIPRRAVAGKLFAHLDRLGLYGRYDYVYLPQDRRKRAKDKQLNKGFAFVNFAVPAHAGVCMGRLAGTKLEGSDSKRMLGAVFAENQGVSANLAALAAHCVAHREDAGLPWVRVHAGMVPIRETAQARRLQ